MIETAWVIERKMSPEGVVYYGKTIEGIGVTTESLDAIRFARKEDAEAVIADNGWAEARAAEHQWG